MGLVYLDGEFYPEGKAKISVFDHGLLYGDGVFEGIRAYNGRIFKLKEHLDRLYHGARAIMLEIPMRKEEMKEAVLETMRQNELRDGYIRLVVSRGVGDLGLDPRKCARPSVFCIAANIQLYPKELYENGLEVATVPTRRNVPEALNAQIKSLNYLNNILAKIESNSLGVPEAVMLNNDGYVCEGTGDNIFLVKDGELITPPSYVGILKGITRNTVMELAQKRDIPVREDIFTRYDIYVADECFLTGTAAEIIPVVKVDSRPIGDGVPGTKTKQLIGDFADLTNNEGTIIYE